MFYRLQDIDYIQGVSAWIDMRNIQHLQTPRPKNENIKEANWVIIAGNLNSNIAVIIPNNLYISFSIYRLAHN